MDLERLVSRFLRKRAGLERSALAWYPSQHSVIHHLHHNCVRTALNALPCRHINTVPRRPLGQDTNNLDASTHHSKTFHASSDDANKLGDSHHSSDDSNPSALERSGLAVTKPPQLRLDLIETFS
jgi:hypothetical protein